MRRFATFTLSVSMLLLGLIATDGLFAQDATKKDEAKKEESVKPESAAKKEETVKKEAPLPTIPPEVQAKLEAARKAVAEAIVAAEEAGLVETTIDPPPILDILITGRALDLRELKKDPKDRIGVSPEVFGAWFTGYGKKDVLPNLDYQKEVRIIQPSKGLKTWYEQRALLFNKDIEDIRKAHADAKKAAEKPKEEPKKAEDKPKEEAKPKEEPKKAEDKPKEEPKKTEEKPK